MLNLHGKEVICNGDYLLPAVAIVITVYAIIHERKATPPAILGRVLDVFQVTKNEQVWHKAIDLVNVSNIERNFGKRLY